MPSECVARPTKPDGLARNKLALQLQIPGREDEHVPVGAKHARYACPELCVDGV